MPKILIIEDEDQIREEMMDWLQFEGFDVIGAANGRLGLEAIYKETPDLIVCDIAMPEVDGHRVLIELRANVNFSHIPFIFLTASADRASVRQGMNLGADDYLAKPFTHAEVLSTVNSRLEKKAVYENQLNQQLETITSALTEEREKRLLKSRLVAMFSHDFRNPLASILSSSGIIRTYGDRIDPEKKKQHFDRIDGAVHLLVQMLDDMLMVAEMESGYLKYSPVSMNVVTFIKGIIDEFSLIDHNDHLITLENTHKHQIEADPKLLRQIITNLISNALKYSAPQSEVKVQVSGECHQLIIAVSDQGIGIPEESIPYIFEPFHRANNVKDLKGTGLGLNIVKDCVERHNGQITVDSKLGVGTTFTVTLSL